MEIIAAIAEMQHGLVNRAQCLAAGLSPAALDRRIASGALIKEHPCVYALPGAPRTWRRSLMAAVLWAGPGTVVSHRAAAALWRLPRFDEGLVEVSARKEMRRKGIAYHRIAPLAPQDAAKVDGLPVTTPARTIVDLAAVVPGAAVERALDDFLRRRLVTLDGVLNAMGRVGTKGRKGMRALRWAIAVRMGQGGPSHSLMERRLYRVLLDGGLPAPRKQYRVFLNGEEIAQIDCAYPSVKIAIEADSYKWHGTRTAWNHDYDRDRLLRSMGWRVLRFSWEEIYFHPNYVVAEVWRALDEVAALTLANRG